MQQETRSDQAGDAIGDLDTTDPSSLWCRCASEYELVQSKIDRIGEFKFKVRTWSITLISASVAAVATSKLPLAALLGSAILVAIFALLEQEQAVHSRRLGDRAVALEKFLNQVGRSRRQNRTQGDVVRAQHACKEISGSPRIAKALRASAAVRLGDLAGEVVTLKGHMIYPLQLLALGAISLILYLASTPEVPKDHAFRGAVEGRTLNYERSSGEYGDVVSRIESARDQLYLLVGEIHDGDMDQIDTYWNSLASALVRLRVTGWTPPVGADVSKILASLPIELDPELLETAKRLEEVARPSSTEPPEEDLDDASDLASRFEVLLEALLDGIDGAES